MTCWKGYETERNEVGNMHLCPIGTHNSFYLLTAKSSVLFPPPCTIYRQRNLQHMQAKLFLLWDKQLGKLMLLFIFVHWKTVIISHCLVKSKLLQCASITHLLSVIAAWSEVQCHGDSDGISLAESKQTVYCYQVSVFILGEERRELK